MVLRRSAGTASSGSEMTHTPTAVGECPVPVISPAVVNALARLSGMRYRSLPLVTL
jgi:CO/xanthine dehydrogenase Mo-binding subunit